MKWIKPLSYSVGVLIVLAGIYYLFFSSSEKANLKWNKDLEHARMLSYLRRYHDSELQYYQLLKAKPDSHVARMELVLTLYYQGKYQEALDQLQKIPPGQRDEKMELLMADINLPLKNYAEAEAIYKKHLQQFPEDQQTHLRLAELLSWQKKYEESLKIYQQLLSKDPTNKQLRRQYALLLVWMGRHEEGAEELKKTLAQEKEIPVNKERGMAPSEDKS